MERFMDQKLADLKLWKGGPVKVFVFLLILFLCVAVLSWADPKFKVKAILQKSWNFDSETAGTLPPNFLVGTLVDGRSAGKWQVIDMKTSLSLLDKLDRRDHTRIRKVLQSSEVPSAPHVFAQLKNRGYFTDFNVVLVGETTTTDFDLKVSFLPIAGRGDMGGGLIWRARDHQNYYITRGPQPIGTEYSILPCSEWRTSQASKLQSHHFRQNLAHSPSGCPRQSFSNSL